MWKISYINIRINLTKLHVPKVLNLSQFQDTTILNSTQIQGNINLMTYLCFCSALHCTGFLHMWHKYAVFFYRSHIFLSWGLFLCLSVFRYIQTPSNTWPKFLFARPLCTLIFMCGDYSLFVTNGVLRTRHSDRTSMFCAVHVHFCNTVSLLIMKNSHHLH